MQFKFAADKGAAKLKLKHAALNHPRIHRVLEIAARSASSRLGAIQRHIGVPEQHFWFCAVVRRNGDADTGVDDDMMVA